ncbi:hypothetical protein ACFV1N_28960 [Streptosporangium canum]|uniref:hypothetical protein n=1 Tax=Streptosporangium canum TaxID=324952 RepID=UPI003687B61B
MTISPRMIMTLAQHDWPPELEAAACLRCGLSYDEYDDEEEVFCTSGDSPLLVESGDFSPLVEPPVDGAGATRNSLEWRRLLHLWETADQPVPPEADDDPLQESA